MKLKDSILAWLRYHRGDEEAVAREIFKQTGVSMTEARKLVREAKAATRHERNPKRRRAARRNPSLPKGRPEIYGRIVEVKAEKTGDPETVWVHRFPRRLPASRIVGMPNGDVLIKANGRPLWGDV